MSEGHFSGSPPHDGQPRQGLPARKGRQVSRKKKRYPVAQAYAPPPGIPMPAPRVAHPPYERIVSSPPLRAPGAGPFRTLAVVAAIVVVCMGAGWYFFQGPGAAVIKNMMPASRARLAEAEETPIVAENTRDKPAPPQKNPPANETSKPPQRPPTQQTPANPPLPEKPRVEQPPSRPPEKPPEKPPEQAKPVTPPPMPKPPEQPMAVSLTFEKDILPIFQAKCVNCHNDDKKRGGLDVTTLAALTKGGDGGPSVLAGMAEKSPIWTAIKTNQMPPTPNKVNEAERKLIQEWIMQGAKGGAATVQAAKP